MSRAVTIERRVFIRGAVVMAGAAYVGIAMSRPAGAATGTAQAWQLDPSWGYPRGAHGRTSCHCRACLSHATNKLFASETAALAGTAHPGCLCVPFGVAIDAVAYDTLFTRPSVDSVDRRDPEVQEVLDPAPIGTFDGFDPDRGQVGHSVVLTGTHLSAATRVLFGRISASYSVDSSTQITAVVPPGARTGPILVRMPGGLLTSVSVYIVKHRRHVTLAFNGAEATGRLSVVDGLEECRRDMPIVLERLHGDRWNAVARTRTARDGSFRLRAPSAPGLYRAMAPWARLRSNDFCMVTVSRAVTR